MESAINVLQLRRIALKHWTASKSTILASRYFGTSLPKFVTEKREVNEEPTVDDILEDLRKPELSEDEIIQKRFQARLPERIYRKHMLKEPLPLENESDFYNYRLRTYYARFGKASKLNPGICWPTREELSDIIKHDQMFEPPLQEKIQNVEAKRLAAEKAKKDVEAEVEKNMSNLDKWMADYYARIEKKEQKTRDLKSQREKLVEEISEYLGYDIDPRDPRFKEAVEQREKEKKKAVKMKKQQESYDKMLEKLRKIALSK
ncbi:hypothetical protein CDAR_91071 [Caerostris darwini]|uniref:Large ribosomal subunit protein mL64 n=1 Tax=Caerostris darwini TaxID=1538125 RepID=A0AAV4M8J7_9ARAC|nr:hypothetical protein CDAR_91071 [Caerostris darwini]